MNHYKCHQCGDLLSVDMADCPRCKIPEETPHACYFCGKHGEACGTGNAFWVNCCDKSCACGPTKVTKAEAIAAWNSLASRLKPTPKVVRIKRWVGVDYSDIYPDGYDIETFYDRDNIKGNFIDTVEVEIKFTDSRGMKRPYEHGDHARAFLERLSK